MKKYNPATKQWEILDKTSEEETNKIRDKLIKQNITYSETYEGIFIEDETEELIK